VDPSGRDITSIFYSISAALYIASQTYATVIAVSSIAVSTITVAVFIADPDIRGLLVSAGFNPVAETAVIVGEIRALASAATKSVTVLENLDIIIGFVKNNKVIRMAKLGDNAATAVSHEVLAQNAEVFVQSGTLQEGVQAFTVVKQNGQIFIRGSNNFNEQVTDETKTFLQSLFK
jgi:hypothetical protein